MVSVTKDTGWLGRLNANDTSDTGWLSDGVVYQNGFTQVASDPIQYRIVTFGTSGLKLLFIGGIIQNTDTVKLISSTAKTVATFPKAVSQLVDETVGHAKIMLGREISSNWGNALEISVNADGTFTGAMRGQDAGNNELVFVDTCLVIGAPEK